MPCGRPVKLTDVISTDIELSISATVQICRKAPKSLTHERRLDHKIQLQELRFAVIKKSHHTWHNLMGKAQTASGSRIVGPTGPD